MTKNNVAKKNTARKQCFHQKLTNLTLNKIFKLHCKYKTGFSSLQGSCNKRPFDVIFGKFCPKKTRVF